MKLPNSPFVYENTNAPSLPVPCTVHSWLRCSPAAARTMVVALPAMAKPWASSQLSLCSKKSLLFDSMSISAKYQRAQFSEPDRKLKNRRNFSVLRPIRAESSPDYKPEADFYKIEAILRPWRVPHVSSGLLRMGIRGVTVSDVRGFGAQGSSTERQAGSEFSEDKFVAKVKMEIVVTKGQVEEVIDKIIEEARTGEIGDGKIFLIPVSDIIRVRTGERGEKAERMTGGRADLISSKVSL